MIDGDSADSALRRCDSSREPPSLLPAFLCRRSRSISNRWKPRFRPLSVGGENLGRGALGHLRPGDKKSRRESAPAGSRNKSLRFASMGEVCS